MTLDSDEINFFSCNTDEKTLSSPAMLCIKPYPYTEPNESTKYSHSIPLSTMNLVTIVFLSAMCLLSFLNEKNTVIAAFGSRRQYHSYHHISQSSNGNRNISVTASSVSSSKEEVEQILRKAAQIRRRAALLDSDEQQSHLQREITQVRRKI